MKRSRNGALALLALLLATGCAGQAGMGSPGATGSQALSLLDGRTLEGWSHVGGGGFVVQPDGSIVTEGNQGLLYYSARQFRDFTLDLEFKSSSAGANSGVLLRVPQAGALPAVAAEQGYEVEILQEPEPNLYTRHFHRTGAIRDQIAPTKLAARPVGDWNQMRVEVSGQHYQVWVNGEKVNDFYGDRALEGYIALQNHDPDSKVSFRNIRVTPIAPAPGPNSLAERFAVQDQRAPIRILMVTATHGFRHTEGIRGSVDLMEALEKTTELQVDTTETLTALNPENLARYDVLFFANSTLRVEPKDTTQAARELTRTANVRNPVTAAQQKAVIDFVRSGKGVVAAHSGLDSSYGWDEYREMMGGGLFTSHPWVVPARVIVEDPANASVSHMGDSFWIEDEFYILDRNPRWNSRVLLSLDNSTMGPPNAGTLANPHNDDYPVSWIRNYGQGRVFATTLGHFEDTWKRPEFVQHFLTGVRMAAGRIPADFGGQRVKETIADNVWPDDLAIDARGNVWIVELTGKVFLWDAQTKQNRQVAQINTTDPTNIEHGLYGVEIDPNFYAGEPFVYLYYAEPETFVNTLSRFTFSNGQIDLSSEKVLLRVPTEPACCHQAGDLEWGPGQTLFVSTGDTGQSSVRPGNEISEERIAGLVERNNLNDYHWSRLADSERTAQNLQDLRGKILRINKDGSIPKDNPFYGRPGVRWEIYSYGLRNPYRFKYDAPTGRLYIGIVGPDEQTTYDWYNVAEKGGENFGWPRATGRLLYNEWNPGQIPGFVPSIWEYTYAGGGRSASFGPIYRTTGENAFPSVFREKLFVYDWSRKWIKYGDLVTGTFESDTANDVRSTGPARLPAKRLANLKTFDILEEGTSPISMELGPDGCLYLAEFTGFWAPAPGSKVSRYCWLDQAAASP